MTTTKKKPKELPHPSAILGKLIARDIFAIGNEPGSPCRRIEFKGGDWMAKTETEQGGLIEAALASAIAQSLRVHFGR